MARVFLSYAREDIARVAKIARVLEATGHEVWWDRRIRGGSEFSGEIEAALRQADVVVAVWSAAAVNSPWVRDEAAEGRDSGRLVPAVIDRSRPPIGFRQYQGIDLTRHGSRAVGELLDAIDAKASGAEQGASGRRSMPNRSIAAVRDWLRWPRSALAALLLLISAATAFALFRGPETPQKPSIAVLPFAGATGDDVLLGEGLAAQVATDIRRESRLRVMGYRSARLFRNFTDPREIGRGLTVDHVLQGNLEERGGKVRVDVALIDTSDGNRQWSRSFHGELKDLPTIQDQIGRQVARRIGRSRRAAAEIAPRPASAEAYRLFLIGHGQMRSGGELARSEQLLRQAVRLDPSYAPAWADLSLAVRLDNATLSPARREQARNYAERAIALAPKLASGHLALGLVHLTEPKGRAHLERAVELDPSDGRNWFWLAGTREAALEFEGALEALRRNVETEPFGPGSTGFSELAWEMGFREEADAFERRIIATHPDPAQREAARARIAARRGDWSAQALYARRAGMNEVIGRIRVGLPARVPEQDETPLTTLWEDTMNGRLPPVRSLPGMVDKPSEFWTLPGLWETSAALSRMLLNHQRAAELVELYDTAFPSPEAMAKANPGAGFLHHAPTVAIALREVGRGEEAERLLLLAEGRAEAALRRGIVPFTFHASCARLWAVRGKRDLAIGALERAVAMGWPYGMRWPDPWAPRPDLLTEEPAFRGIREDPRLRRIQGSLQRHLARERQELEAIGN